MKTEDHICSSYCSKRGFLKYILVSLVGALTAIVAWGAGRFAFFDAGTKKRKVVSKELLSKLEPHVPYHVPEVGVWLVSSQAGEPVTAFDDRCPHLGCRQNWNPNLGLFECPCHGSQFDLQGTVRRGPASRSMPKLRMTESNDKLSFQEEIPGS